MKKIKNMIFYNFKSLVIFELIYKVLSTIIFVPLFLSAFSLIVKVTGYSYLTLENFISFLLNPLTIIFLIILFLFITFYALIDISTIIIILDSSYNKKKVKAKDAFILGLERSKRVFSLKNILLPILVVLLLPFLNIGLSTGLFGVIKIPEFILDYIYKNRLLTGIYITLIILLFIILFKWFYSLHYFILEGLNFKEARKKSNNLNKKSKIKDFISIILLEFITGIIYFIIVLVLTLFIVLIYKIFGKVSILGNVSITIIWLFILVSFVIFLLLNTPVSYAGISALFYKHKQEINEEVKSINIKVSNEKTVNKRFRVFKCISFLLIFSSLSLFTYSVLNGKYNINIEYVRVMDVTAHRGASINYPENTMLSFEKAKEMGADYIELDVGQTKDKKIVVLHDANLKRTTSLDKNIWEVTYDEIKELDAGSFLDPKFKNERIPLLEEVLEFSKENNIKLNIELKPNGHEENLEKEVVDLINTYDISNNVVVTSQVYSVLENIKKCDENIKTVYVMSLAYGDILKLKYADNFSIESTSITKSLVKKIHNEGKEIYAWTVNTKENMNKMISLNVDNIITDNITLAKNTIYESKTSNIIKEFIKKIESIFNK